MADTLQAVELKTDEAVLIGVITEDFTYHHSTKSANIYKSYINVERESGTVDTLPIMATDKVLNEAFTLKDDKSYGAENYSVCINGLMASYNEHIGTSNKSHLVLYVKASTILIVSDDTKHNNKIELTGYIVKDVSVRTTPGAKDEKGNWIRKERTIADVLLGVNIGNGKHSTSYYIPCILWSKTAIAVGKLKVGSQINIHGRIQSRSYTKKFENGNTEDKVAYEVSVAEAFSVDEDGQLIKLVEKSELKKDKEPKKDKKEKRNKRVTIKTKHNPNGFNID